MSGRTASPSCTVTKHNKCDINHVLLHGFPFLFEYLLTSLLSVSPGAFARKNSLLRTKKTFRILQMALIT